jgi:hypothetical protein
MLQRHTLLLLAVAVVGLLRLAARAELEATLFYPLLHLPVAVEVQQALQTLVITAALVAVAPGQTGQAEPELLTKVMRVAQVLRSTAQISLPLEVEVALEALVQPHLEA